MTTKSYILGDSFILTSYSSLYIDLYQPLLNSTLKSSGVDVSRTLTTDSLSIWLQRAVQISSDKTRESPIDFGTIVSDKDAQAIFTFVCDFWTDSGVAFANALKELFIKIISLISSTRPSDSFIGYLQQWTIYVLKFGRDQRVLYFMLEILTKQVGGTFVLQQAPQFLSQALSYMGSNALANPIGKALFSIYSNILTEWTGKVNNNVKGDDETARKWTALWAEPTRLALLNDKTREHVQIYFLPQMFKRLPQSLEIFIEPMTRIDFNTPENEISVLLGCMKLGQERGILDVLEAGRNVITEEFFETLLHHESPVLRIGALSLIATSQQLTKPVARYVFKVLEKSLDDFFIESDPGFRNQFYSFIRQFVFRIRASSYSLNKDSERKLKKGDKDSAEKLSNEVQFVHDFVSWFIKYLERCLRPSAPYQYRYTGMLLIQLLANSGLDDEIRPECFEKNHDFFPFKEPVYNKTVVRLLIDNIANNYEDVRSTATKILKIAKLPLPYIESYEKIDILVDQSLETISGMRGREGDAGARGLELAFNLFYNFPVTKENPNANIEQCTKLLEKILSKLEAEIEFSNKNLALAVRERPVHGFFTALGFILESVDFYSFAKDAASQKEWQGLIDRMLKCANSVWENVKDILCHDSPEGNMPKEFEANYDPELEAKYGPANQIILSYSWRAIKESTTMLKVLLDRVPRKGQKGPGKTPTVIESDIFENKVVVSIGNLLLTQLATVRHRGAFSSIYPTFVSCCKRCNLTNGLEHQPEEWLSENINLIKIKAQFITRRSGGLPYLITAVLTAELDQSNRTLISNTFDKLLAIAQSPAVSSGDDKVELPQVHAFNCIKALFVETNLSSRSAWFIEPALKLSIVSFSSDIWAIRNCAVMLFTALQNRLFGTAKPTKSKHSVSTTSAKIFFNKFKSIRGTLLDMLKNYVNNIDDVSSQIETIFPALALLSRLEATVGYTGLEDFKPLIVACLGSKVWKVREMAARVIPPLLKDQDTVKIFQSLVSESSPADQNKLHGVLMAGLNIILARYDAHLEQKRLKLAGVTSQTEKQQLEAHQGVWIDLDFVKYLLSRFDELVVNNPAAETAVAYIRVLKEVYTISLSEPNQKTAPEFDEALIEKCKALWNHQTSDGLSSSRRVLQSEMAETVLVSAFSSKEASKLGESLGLIKDMVLSYDNYEVQLMAMQFLDEHVEYLTGGNSEIILKGLWELFDSDAWNQVCGPAARLFSTIFAKFSQSPSSVSFRKDVPKYWSVLYKTISPKETTEDINESCLEALGIFTGQLYNTHDDKETDKKIEQWVGLIQSFGHEDESYPSRSAALNSLLSFLSTANKPDSSSASYRVTFYIDALIQLFLFLSDDDEDIRAETSSYVSRMLDFKFMATSAYCEKQLLYSYLSSQLPAQFSSNKQQQSLVVNHLVLRLFGLISSSEPAHALLSKALAVDDTLFIFEKQNLFRDQVLKFEQYRKAIQILSLGTAQDTASTLVAAETVEVVRQWVAPSISAIQNVLKNELRSDSKSGLLKWAKDPEIVEEVSRIGVAVDVYLGLERDGELAQEIKELQQTENFTAMLTDFEI